MREKVEKWKSGKVEKRDVPGVPGVGFHPDFISHPSSGTDSQFRFSIRQKKKKSAGRIIFHWAGALPGR